jgi:hypothetical protein
MDEQNEPKLENMTVDQLVQGVASQVWQNGRASAFMEYVNEMKRRLQSEARWIPVSERLPEKDVPVLGTFAGKPAVDTCCFGEGKWWQLSHEILVTHWKPLPTPPTEG